MRHTEVEYTFIETFMLVEFLKDNLNSSFDDILDGLREKASEDPGPDIPERLEVVKAKTFIEMIEYFRGVVNFGTPKDLARVLEENLKFSFLE